MLFEISARWRSGLRVPRVAACVILGLFLSGFAQTGAAVKYYYDGPRFQTLSPFMRCVYEPCRNYTNAMRVSGTLSSARPLEPQKSYDIRDLKSLGIEISFSDGINTYSSDDPNVYFVVF